jgi:hypothetical protein
MEAQLLVKHRGNGVTTREQDDRVAVGCRARALDSWLATRRRASLRPCP